jgi:tyrosine-protein phosphatase YwqE
MLSFFTSRKHIADLSFIGVDMHSHLLPGLDDGLQKMEDTISFIKQLKALGYSKLICTPHIFAGVHPNSPETILPILESVREVLRNREIDVTIEAAAEYMIDHEFELAVSRGDQLLSFGDKYVLIEMSYMAASPYLQQVIFELKLAGYQPILAHPERYSFYHRDYQQYQELKDRGCLFQINLLSLCGYYGKPVKKIAEKLLKQKMVEFVGTDMHHQNHMHALQKFSKDKELYRLLENAGLHNNTLL